MKTLQEYKNRYGELAGEKNYYLDKAFEAQAKLDSKKRKPTKKAKAAVKKAAVKKPVAKKPATKKPVARKTPAKRTTKRK